MAFEFPSTLILVLSSLWIVLKLVQTYMKSGSDRASSLLLDHIPGPKRLPVIGNLHLLVSKSPPHHVFRDLAAKYGPLMRLQLGGVPFLIISSAEVAREVLKTHDIAFADRLTILASTLISYNNTNIGGAPYGDHWRQLRKICTLEMLSAKRVKSFLPIRQEVTSSTAERIASSEGSPANLSELVMENSFDITSRASIGKETEEKGAMVSAIKEIARVGSGLVIGDLYPSVPLLHSLTGMKSKLKRISRHTDRIIQRIIDVHRADAGGQERQEDLVDVLLKHQQEGAEVHLTDDNIKAVLMDMLLAGAETSATAIEWAMAEMVRNPTTLNKARDEVRRVFDEKGYVDEEKFDSLKYLKLVIKETLRMHPPLPLLVPRQTRERCEVNGYEIPEKTRVIVNGWALGRDPTYWKEAERFMPERFEDSSLDFKGNDFAYIPFGSGRRMCPGMTFGLANVEYPLSVLLYHFDWALPNGIKCEQLDMTEEFGSAVNRKEDLLLIPTLKRPLKAPIKSSTS